MLALQRRLVQVMRQVGHRIGVGVYLLSTIFLGDAGKNRHVVATEALCTCSSHNLMAVLTLAADSPI